MKTGWLIYQKEDAEQNKAYINWFIEEARIQSLSLKLIFREDLTIGILDNKQTILLQNERIQYPDFAIIRTMEPMLSLHVEDLGIPAFNSSIITQVCNNKALTHHHIGNLNIPMVDTIYCKKEHLNLNPPFSYPYVVKEVTGRSGKQVFFIEGNQDWVDCLQTVKTDVIIQRANVQLGKDIRVFVVGKEIVGAVMRESKQDFRANYKLGGSARWYDLSVEEESTINEIISYFDFGMVGIDFLIGLDGELLFNEIEDVVGSRTLSAVSEINILEKYVSFIKTRIG